MVSSILRTGLFAALIFFIAAAIEPAPAVAQSALSSSGFDTDQPIEILADSLEIQQEKQRAVFEGNVQVLQGEMRLKAAKLIVHYAENEKNKKASSEDDPPNIRKIDAIGDVFLSSPRETAKGDTGVYDVVNKRIELAGNVVLTQGKNVLRGQNMTLDLVSGKSRIEGSGSGNTKGRVRGIFVPQKKN